MQAIEDKVISRIYGKGRGWSFFKNDFVDLGSADAIDKALSRLTKSGRVRRVMRGIYDYPKYSRLLEQQLSPDIDQVAQALARKFGWTIQVSGNAALNILGLSTQVPARYLYLSDGQSKTYHINDVELSFKKTALKDMGLKLPESALLVQALKTRGQQSISLSEKQKILAYFPKEKYSAILKDTQYMTSWVYEQIKQIFEVKA
jgi:predicted oxidoreductase